MHLTHFDRQWTEMCFQWGNKRPSESYISMTVSAWTRNELVQPLPIRVVGNKHMEVSCHWLLYKLASRTSKQSYAEVSTPILDSLRLNALSRNFGTFKKSYENHYSWGWEDSSEVDYSYCAWKVVSWSYIWHTHTFDIQIHLTYKYIWHTNTLDIQIHWAYKYNM